MLFFHDLRTSMGDAALAAALADYYASYAFTVASPSDLAAAFSRAGFDILPVLAAYGA